VDNSCHVNELMKRRERPLSIVTRNWDHAENSMSRAQFILRKTKSLVGLQSSSFKQFISWLRVKMKSNRPITSLNSRIMRQRSVHKPRSSCDRNQFEENSEPRVRYRGVFKSRADIKFGEFILPLRISNINIIQAIELRFKRVRRRAHPICSCSGKSYCRYLDGAPRRYETSSRCKKNYFDQL
jgi:hypothetical protein